MCNRSNEDIDSKFPFLDLASFVWFWRYFPLVVIINTVVCIIRRARDRKELLTKAQLVFHDLQVQSELQSAQAERTKQQRELCDILYEKVIQVLSICYSHNRHVMACGLYEVTTKL